MEEGSTVSQSTNQMLTPVEAVGTGVAFEEPKRRFGPRCPWHKRYKGLRKPRGTCVACHDIYQYNRRIGVFEKRRYYP